jgi:hypothetical protein
MMVGAALDTPAVQARLKDMTNTVVSQERRSGTYLQQYVEAETTK